MKLNYLTKLLPFISTLVLLIFLNVSNQKVNTKLRILIWNTPSYSLGTYLSVSAGIGFIISYILTTKLANINSLNNYKSLQYKSKSKNESTNHYDDSYFGPSEEKTLIERDIHDPSPTLNAQFRVIGKTERYYTDDIDSEYKYDYGNDYEQSYSERNDKNDSFNQETQTTSDWNDESFSTW
tara:strand:- start:1485 stop:2027 length:543 start_codon:yes stop_codon:yes gene_type:complete